MVDKTMETAAPQDRAVLIGVYSGSSEKKQCEEHLEELAQLCNTLGIEPSSKMACGVRKFTAATFLSEGKLEEVVAEVKSLGVNLVIFDDEIRPSQQRNLEEVFGLTVMDRTEVILEVFSQHARSREARLQVELAQVKYQFPRLRRLWTHLSRQRGGGVQLKGEGEKQIELDKRLLQKRLQQLEGELKEMTLHRETQRTGRQRSGMATFAIIGYTNAGKSTLLNALTDAGVLVEDKLFATLDTTTRKFALPNKQEILLIDTVGFIRKLPHQLVAAFRSTLEEAVHADFLLHVVDVSHPNAEEQAEATLEVLKELGAHDKPIITVLNKIDNCQNKLMLQRMRIKYTKTVRISALKQEGFDELLERMEQSLAERRRELHLRIPQSDYGKVSEVLRWGKVIHQEYEGNDVLLHAELPLPQAARVEKYVVKDHLQSL